MGVIRRPKSVAGQIFLLVVIFVDIGLLIWGWHIYQRRQAEKLDGSGFDLSRTPEKEKNPYAAMPDPIPVEDLEASMRLIIKESRDLPALGQGRGGAPPVQTESPGAKKKTRSAPRPPRTDSARSMRDVSAAERRKVKRAKGFYYALKRDARFRNSKVLTDWKKEFLSHSDLRKINAEYQKDRDAIKFMVKMVGSSNFRGMFGKYMLKEEMRGFVKEMAGSAVVKAAADTFLADANMGALAKHLGFAKNKMEGKSPNSVSALEGLRGNEDYRNALEN
jgi:hypothetical protein